MALVAIGACRDGLRVWCGVRTLRAQFVAPSASPDRPRVRVAVVMMVFTGSCCARPMARSVSPVHAAIAASPAVAAPAAGARRWQRRQALTVAAAALPQSRRSASTRPYRCGALRMRGREWHPLGRTAYRQREHGGRIGARASSAPASTLTVRYLNVITAATSARCRAPGCRGRAGRACALDAACLGTRRTCRVGAVQRLPYEMKPPNNS